MISEECQGWEIHEGVFEVNAYRKNDDRLIVHREQRSRARFHIYYDDIQLSARGYQTLVQAIRAADKRVPNGYTLRSVIVPEELETKEIERLAKNAAGRMS